MRLYLRALSYFRQDWLLIVFWMLTICLSAGFGLVIAWPMAVLVDSVLSSPPRDGLASRVFLSLLPTSPFGQIVGLALFSVGLKLLQDAMGVVQSIICNHINYRGLMRIRCELYKKLQALSLSYHRTQPQGDLIYRLTSDTFGCQTILSVVVHTGMAALTLCVMSAILASRSPSLTLIAFSIAPVLALLNFYYGKEIKDRSLECRDLDASYTTTVQRSMSCISLIQAFGRERDEYHRFHDSVRANIAGWWRLNRQQFSYNLLTGAAFGIGGSLVFGYGGYIVYREQFLNPTPNGMTIGDLLIFFQYLGMLWGPLFTLTSFATTIQSGAAGAQRVFEVLDRETIIKDVPHSRPFPRKPRTIELDHVTFGYERHRPVLRDLTVSIPAGHMVAFVGPSGVGKSTLLNLLPRFYDPCEGAVRFDGVDIRELRLADVRQHVALVLQDSILLPTTIAQNIAYGRPTATDAEICDAARLARCSEFIEQLPNGYNTVIAEGGTNLSGGQRQRISIARALLTGAPILILDEATSALDPYHEQLIAQSLESLKELRTLIVVSHRLSTAAMCDQIFVMSGGEIVEYGTHEQLIARRKHATGPLVPSAAGRPCLEPRQLGAKPDGELVHVEGLQRQLSN